MSNLATPVIYIAMSARGTRDPMVPGNTPGKLVQQCCRFIQALPELWHCFSRATTTVFKGKRFRHEKNMNLFRSEIHRGENTSKQQRGRKQTDFASFVGATGLHPGFCTG